MTSGPQQFHDPLNPANQELVRKYVSTCLDEEVGPLAAGPETLCGGIENRSYKVAVAVGGRIRSFVLRMPPEQIPDWRKGEAPDNLMDPYDLEREFRILLAVGPFGLGAPRVWSCDAEGRHFGVPCFLMEFLPGEPLSATLYAGGNPREPACEPDLMRPYARSIAAVSRTPYQANRFLAEELPRWPLERVMRWTQQRARGHRDDPLVAYALDWLTERQPEPGKLVLAHGDPNPTNLLVEGGSIMGLVDWEFACLIDQPLWALGVFFNGYYRPLVTEAFLEEYCLAAQTSRADLEWFLTRGLLLDWIEGNTRPPVREWLAAAVGFSVSGAACPRQLDPGVRHSSARS